MASLHAAVTFMVMAIISISAGCSEEDDNLPICEIHPFNYYLISVFFRFQVCSEECKCVGWLSGEVPMPGQVGCHISEMEV